MKIDKIGCMLRLQSKNLNLFKSETKYREEISHKSGNIVKNANPSVWNNFVFSSLDRINFVLINHPKLASFIIKASEKIISKKDRFFDRVKY